MGCFEDKVIKNGVAAELTYAKYRDTKTVGIIERNEVKKLTKIAVPKGPIAAILSTTNPTSTVDQSFVLVKNSEWDGVLTSSKILSMHR